MSPELPRTQPPAKLPLMHRTADMSMTQLFLIAVAFGFAISVAIEFLNRYQIRAFYGAITLSARHRAPACQVSRRSVTQSTSWLRCALLGVVLSGLAYGSMTRSVPCVVGMIAVIIGYLGYVSWEEIRQLRFRR